MVQALLKKILGPQGSLGFLQLCDNKRGKEGAVLLGEAAAIAAMRQ